MGIAVIIPNVNYQDANLGKVTLQQGVPLRSMTIVGPDEITEPTPFSVNFFPANTSQRGVVWSIVSGGTYASINAETGELTPIVGAVANDVVIRATSSADNTIYAEKTVSVSYGMVYEEKLALVGDGFARINTGYQIKPSTKFFIDYQYISLPAKTSSAQYRTVWGAYVNESSPVCRHLLTIINNNTTNKQGVAWGNDKVGTTKGLTASSLTEIATGVRIQEEISIRDGYRNSYGQDAVTQNFFGGFANPTNPLVLFSSSVTAATASEMACFASKAYENDVLVLNLVPCTLVADIPGTKAQDGNAHYAGENGMWDKIGNKFHPNAYSSGSFTVYEFD
jgi:hypothetical protein